MLKSANITAIASYVPDTILSNADLEKMVDTSDEWIVSRTGIRERRILTDPLLATSDMAAEAILKLLADAEVQASEIDCVILATATPDHIMVSTASIVCEKAKLSQAWGMDVGAACSGFLYALSVGAGMVESGRCKKVLVVGADKNSSIINYKDRNTCILFGDGAGVVLLEPNDDGLGLKDFKFQTDGTGREHLLVLAGGSKHPSSNETLALNQNHVFQNGKVVFKSAIEGMYSTCTEVLKRNDLSIDDIDWLVPHQANMRILQTLGDKLGIPAERVAVNIEKFGNTTAATIPLCLDSYKKRILPGQQVMLTAFGAGFSWGSSLLKWGHLRNQ